MLRTPVKHLVQEVEQWDSMCEVSHHMLDSVAAELEIIQHLHSLSSMCPDCNEQLKITICAHMTCTGCQGKNGICQLRYHMKGTSAAQCQLGLSFHS